MSAPAVSLAYERARECIRIARAHITEWPPSLDGWARKLREARYWREEARRLRKGAIAPCPRCEKPEGMCSVSWCGALDDMK